MKSGAPNLFIVIVLVCLCLHSAGQSKQEITVVTIADTPSCYCFLNVSLSAVKNASTCSAGDGALTLNVTGGTGNYSYTWTDQAGTVVANSKDLQNVSPGFYFVSVKDNGNSACSGQNYFEVGSDMSVSFATTISTNCLSPNGSISTTLSGGSGQFSFEWTFPDGKKATQQNISGLGAGQYSLKITDLQRGCSVSKNVSVKSSAALSLITLSNTSNTSCLSPNGAIDIHVSNGSGQYKYYWYDLTKGEYISYDQDLTNASGGQYSLYVVDQVSGCVAYETITLEETTTKPEFTYTISPNTNCSSPFNGSIDLSPSGTPGPYTVTWTSDGTNSISSAEDPEGLAPGIYGVTIRDNSTGCQTVHSISSANPIVVGDNSVPGTVVTVDQTSNNTDCSSPNGQITVSIVSESGYSYYWRGPSNYYSESEDISSLKGGTYTLYVATSCNTNNAPPVIAEEALTASADSEVAIDLMEIISDPDDNLDPSTIEIIEAPASGVEWLLTPSYLLTLSYNNTKFRGIDYLKVKACDDLGACTERILSITINEDGVVVYNAVAPNSIGDNKFMRIINLPDTENKVSIFNRWGDKVFEVYNYNNTLAEKRFEGVSDNGKELPTGTYFYKIEFGDGRKELTGYVALKR